MNRRYMRFGRKDFVIGEEYSGGRFGTGFLFSLSPCDEGNEIYFGTSRDEDVLEVGTRHDPVMYAHDRVRVRIADLPQEIGNRHAFAPAELSALD